jgi:quercetin dioxygenase-like cupin family protein
MIFAGSAGKQRLTINGDRVTVREGEFVHMSPNVPHGARSIGEAIVLDVFTPIGADWKD